MSQDARTSALKTVLFLPLPSEADATGIKSEWPEFIEEFGEADLDTLGPDESLAARIDKIISVSAQSEQLDRSFAIQRLLKLHSANLLSASQEKATEAAIWDRAGESGWPENTHLYNWVFLNLPGAKRAKPLFKEHVIDALAENNVNPATLMSLKAGMESYAETVDQNTLLNVFEACLKWEPQLEPDDPFKIATGAIASVNQHVSREIGYSLTASVLPRMELDKLPNSTIGRWKKNLSGEAITSMVVTVPYYLRCCPKDVGFSLQAIQLAIASRDPERVKPAFFAIKNLIDNPIKGMKIANPLVGIVLATCEKRDQPGLNFALATLRKMIKANMLTQADVERTRNLIAIVLTEYSYSQKTLDIPSLATLPVIRTQARKLLETMEIEESDPLFSSLQELRNDPLPEVRLVK